MYSISKVEKTLILLLIILGFSTLFFYQSSKDSGESFCLFLNLFHFKCPGCGLFKGSFYFWKGIWRHATSYNLLSVPINVCFIIGTIFLLIDLYCNQKLFEKIFINFIFIKHKTLTISIIFLSYIFNYFFIYK